MKLAVFALLFGAWILSGCSADPRNLKTVSNYAEGRQLSREAGKPVFLHFTCHGCMGTDEFHQNLVTSRSIQRTLNEDFITILLYVDDRRPLTPSDTLNCRTIGLSEIGLEQARRAATVGAFNAVLQTDLFHAAYQPMYTVLHPNGKILVPPFGYTAKDRVFFLKKLEAGIGLYENYRD